MKSFTKTGIRGTTRRLHRLCRLLRRQGLISMAAERLVPATSFTAVNVDLGVFNARFLDFALGTPGKLRGYGKP